jgi:hypothetical protein
MPNFTITDLYDVINEVLDLDDPSEAQRITKAVIKVITDALNRGENIEIHGFGRFLVKLPRKTHKIPNVIVASPPGESTDNIYSPVTIAVPGRKKVYFIPSPQVTAMLNMNGELTHAERKAMQNWHKD